MKAAFLIFLLPSMALAAKFIVENPVGTPHIIQADGFIPKGALAAPAGDYIESDLDKVAGVWVLNTTRRNSRIAAETTENIRLTSVRTTRVQRIHDLAVKFKAGTDTAQDRQDALKVLILDFARDLD